MAAAIIVVLYFVASLKIYISYVNFIDKYNFKLVSIYRSINIWHISMWILHVK